MRPRARGLLAFGVIIALATAGLFVPSVAAAPGTITGLFLDSEPGDYIGQGAERTLTPAGSGFIARLESPGSSQVVIDVTGPSWWTVWLAAAPGEALAVGTYTGAARAAFRTTGQPGMDVYGESRGCNTLTGTFTVHEIAWAGDGVTLERFAATFEQHCEGIPAALFGEVRYQSTVDFGAISVPDGHTFATRNVGSTSSVWSFVVGNPGSRPLIVSSVAISGANAADFLLAGGTCLVAPVAVGGTCTIGVRFSPTAAGQRQASVDIVDDTVHGTHAIPIAGVATLPVANLTVTPASLAFGNVVVSTASATKTVTVKSTGTIPLTVSSVAVGGANPTEFTLVGQTCTAAPLAIGATCTVSLAFKPTAAAARSATVRITTDAPSGVAVVPITGTGVGPTSQAVWAALKVAGPAYTWNFGSSLGRTTTATGAYLHTIYTTDRIGSSWASGTGPRIGVNYVRSADDGTGWSAARRLNPTTQHGGRNAIATSGSYVYAIWVSVVNPYSYSNTAARVLYFRANSSHGASTAWGSIIRLSGLSGRVDYPAIAATGASVYVAWTDSTTGAVKLSISRDRGKTWATKQVGSTLAKYSDGYYAQPSVAAAGAYVGVAWDTNTTGGERAIVSSNSGGTFGPPLTLTSSAQSETTASAVGTRVAFAWNSGSAVGVRMWKAGVWQPVRTVATFSSTGIYKAGYEPVVALNGTVGVAVAWSDCRAVGCQPASGVDLTWSESNNDGALFTERQVLAKSTDSASRKVNDSASILWPSATRRYVLWNGWTTGTLSYRLYLRIGTGSAF